MSLTAGIDLGGSYTKVVVTEPDGGIVARWIRPTGYNFAKAGRDALDACLENAGIDRDDVRYVAATGFGRYTVEIRDLAITELTCHAFAAHTLYPEARTVLDAGGQTLKAIRVDEHGRVRAFRLNDKCAAGTGRFLGAASEALEIPLGDLGPLALTAHHPVKMTTTCTVFAESEILGWLALGRKTEDVVMGVHTAIASRAISLLRRTGLEPEITFTGGVSRNTAMVKLLEELVEGPINVSEESHFCGAIGAALYGLDRALVDAAAEVKGGLV